MNNSRLFKIVAGLLAVVLVTAVGFLVHARRQNSMWEMQVYMLAGYEGTTLAMRDFKAGEARLFVVAGGRDKDTFSGTNDGPFEVWYPQYYPQYYPFRYSTEKMVEFYNSKMRYMHEHPEKFLAQTNQVTQLKKQ